MQNAHINLGEWFSTLDPAQHLFAILDAAREGRIPIELQSKGVQFTSLYRGEPEEVLHEVAPYLVRIDAQSEFARWLLNEGWGDSWGIFPVASATLEELRRHFRHFLLVRDPAGAELYFRFYDPRVLRVYLPTCTGSEAKQFFGPVTAYVTEANDGQAISVFSRAAMRTVRLSDLQSSPASELIANIDWTDTTPKTANRRLRIRQEQMKAFSQYMNESFIKRAAQHLRQEYPDATKTMTDDELNDFIDAGGDRAGKHGLTRENEIVVFLESMLVFGRDFDDKTDWAPEILQNSDLTGADKTEALRERRDVQAEKPIGD